METVLAVHDPGGINRIPTATRRGSSDGRLRAVSVEVVLGSEGTERIRFRSRALLLGGQSGGMWALALLTAF